MRQPTRKKLSIAAAVIVALGLAAAGTTLASSNASSPHHDKAGVNASKLNGYRAKDLVKETYIRDSNSIDEFDTCAFTTELTQTVKVPKKGYLMAWGTVGAARDTDHPDPAELVARLKAGPKVISSTDATQLTTDGSFDGHVTIHGMVPVKKGTRTVHLQLSDCIGVAFITDRSISSLFVPFGSIKIVPPGPKAKFNN